MLDEHRIKYFVPADYSKDSKLEILIKQIIDRTKSNEVLEKIHYDCINEKNVEIKSKSEDERHREDLINDLESSVNFANTHKVIAKLSECSDWSESQKAKLIKIALTNNQVKYILSDNDVEKFYIKIIADDESESANKIKK